MNKETFIKKLKAGLVGLSKEEVDDVLSDYEEYFSSGLEEKRTEEDIAKSLGDPKAIAKQIKVTAKIKKAETNWSAGNITRAVLATAGLGLLNVIFILGPFMGLVGTLFGLFAAGIGMFAGGVVSFIVSIIMWSDPNFASNYVNMGAHPAAVLFLGISLACFGVLWTVGSGYLAKWFYILTVKYLKLNARVITGEKE